MRTGSRRVLPLIFVALLATASRADGQALPGTGSPSEGSLPIVSEKWTGDFDGMVARHTIRVLVVYSRMFYFVDRGTQRGATWETFQLFEKFVNRKLKTRKLPVRIVFVPMRRDQLIPALLAGEGDVAAANLGVTPERAEIVDFSSPLRSDRDEIVVTGPASSPIGSLDELSGREVYVRKSTSYYENLERLNARFRTEGKPPVRLRLAPEELQDDDVLEMLNAGLVKIVVADSAVARFWSQVFPNIRLHPDAAVARGEKTAWLIRKKSPKLKAVLDEFLAKYPEGSLERNMIFQRYLKSTKWVKSATSDAELAKFQKTVDLFRKYGETYDMDHLLLMAQGYQESQLDQAARSRVGAIGIMQVMPETGKQMNVGDIRQVEPNVHAGVKYIRYMVDQYYAGAPMTPVDKALFAFASYDAGPARIESLRRDTAKRGLDPNVWFDNVELLVAERIGRETVQYVSNIYKYYVAYKLIAEDDEARRKTIEELKEKTP